MLFRDTFVNISQEQSCQADLKNKKKQPASKLIKADEAWRKQILLHSHCVPVCKPFLRFNCYIFGAMSPKRHISFANLTIF